MEFLEATLTKIVQETSDSYSFIMTIPEGFTWKAGQHVAWQINGFELDAEDRNTRVFTIASTMADGYLMFTTRIATSTQVSRKPCSVKSNLVIRLVSRAPWGPSPWMRKASRRPSSLPAVLALRPSVLSCGPTRITL